MTEPTSKEVFVQAVKDHLDGTPHAHHPVQFEPVKVPRGGLVSCTLCWAVVKEAHADEHRRWHDKHVRAHDRIMEQAQRHVPEPRYGGGAT